MYHKTKYWLWLDNKKFGNCVYKRSGNEYKQFLCFEPNFEPEKDLFGSYTVATFALDFAIKQGYEKAVLYGVLDGNYNIVESDYSHAGNIEIEYKHFYDDVVHKMSHAALESWKTAIFSYSNPDVRAKTIEIKIPYLNC